MFKVFRMLFWLTKEEKAVLKKLKNLQGLECSKYAFRIKREQE